MSSENKPSPSNIIQFQKPKSYGVYVAEITQDGEVAEGESVGVAFRKPENEKFRLKIFLFPENNYFVVPDDAVSGEYLVLSLEEYSLANGEKKSSWNRVGRGRTTNGFISLRIPLLPENLYISVSPSEAEARSERNAA